MEVGKSQDLTGWVCKLETLVSQWFSSCLKVSRLDRHEKPMFQFKSKGGKSCCPSLKAGSQEELCPTQGTVGLFVLFRSSIDWGPPTLERAIGFTQSANLNLNLIPKHSHRHTHSVQPNIWTPHGPVKLTHKISHHTVFWVLEITTRLMMKYGGKS